MEMTQSMETPPQATETPLQSTETVQPNQQSLKSETSEIEALKAQIKAFEEEKSNAANLKLENDKEFEKLYKQSKESAKVMQAQLDAFQARDDADKAILLEGFGENADKFKHLTLADIKAIQSLVPAPAADISLANLGVHNRAPQSNNQQLKAGLASGDPAEMIKAMKAMNSIPVTVSNR